MRKVSLALAIAAMVVFTFGCAYTNYPVIEDNEQTSSSVGPHIVNTSGQALIRPETQVVTIYADEALEFLSFVNQDADGNQTIYTHSNSCEAGEPCYQSPNWFAGMTFLNDDRTGCWIWKAPNPVEGDVDIFDGTYNASCDKKGNLKLLLSTTARFMEAGDDGGNGQSTSGGSGLGDQGFSGGVSVQDYIAALGQLDSIGVFGDYPEYGLSGWKITFTPDNSALWINDTRFLVDGVVAVVDIRNRRMALDARTGNAADMLNQLADWIDVNGYSATATISIAGISPAIDVGFMDSDHYRALAGRAGP